MILMTIILLPPRSFTTMEKNYYFKNVFSHLALSLPWEEMHLWNTMGKVPLIIKNYNIIVLPDFTKLSFLLCKMKAMTVFKDL